MRLMSPDDLRDLISDCADGDQALEVIERNVIAPARLSEDQKSGLWLYAWSSAGLGHRRRRRQLPGEALSASG